jgi:hypothetical protein
MAVVSAEETVGVVVQRVHQFDAQLIEGHLGSVVEPCGHRDGAHHRAADAEPWADHEPALGRGWAAHAIQGGFGQGDQECSSGSNGDRRASWRSLSSPAQATSGQLTIVCAMAGSASASRTKLLPATRGPNSAVHARVGRHYRVAGVEDHRRIRLVRG